MLGIGPLDLAADGLGVIALVGVQDAAIWKAVRATERLLRSRRLGGQHEGERLASVPSGTAETKATCFLIEANVTLDPDN